MTSLRVPLAGRLDRTIVRREARRRTRRSGGAGRSSRRDAARRRSSGTRGRWRVGSILEDEVLHAAVAALRDLPLPAEIELVVGARR